MTGKRCVLPWEVSSAQKSVVTTNGEKSAEAIVGGNTEGPNEIQFMSFRIVSVSWNSLGPGQVRRRRLETEQAKERSKQFMSTQLMERILSKENLKIAEKAVIANKGSAGIDGMKVEELSKFIEENGQEIIEKIRNRKYRPSPVKRVQIPKPDGSKRNLGIPSVRDRWLQQAVYQVLSPIFEEEFSNSSYGFRC